MNVITLKNISRIYSQGDVEVKALSDVSLDIEKGELVAITGRSGSGKSTLMNILGILDLADTGSYFFEGEKIGENIPANLSSALRNEKIGFVFQNYNLVPTLTAIENVELPLIYRGLGKKKRRALSIAALKEVGLESRINHKPSEMSGGQQQRVAIARAIAASPPVILADEPTGNLDSAAAEAIMNLFIELNKKGTTVILITHDDKISAMCRRVIEISDGKVVGDSAL